MRLAGQVLFAPAGQVTAKVASCVIQDQKCIIIGIKCDLVTLSPVDYGKGPTFGQIDHILIEAPKLVMR